VNRERFCEQPSARSSRQRLRPGQLDGLVLELSNANGKHSPLGVTTVAKALGRSARALGNCLVRLAAAAHVRQVSERPRRYRGAAAGARKHGAGRRPRKEASSRRSGWVRPMTFA
jgi:hypothetical protein